MPRSNDQTLILEAFLPYRLSRLTNRISQALAAIYQDRFAITIPEWRVLAILGSHAPLSSNQIAERGSMDKAKVSRAVSRLLDKDLITRETDPEDNRLLVLDLSPAGRAVHGEIAPMALEWEHGLIDALTHEERAALDRIIDKLESRVRGEKPE